MKYAKGQRVRISSPGIASADGVILEASTPEELPAIQVPEAAPVELVREVLHETNVVQVLMIEVDQTYMFCALVHANGEIRSLRDQILTLTVTGFASTGWQHL